MAAHSSAVSLVRGFVDALAKWVEAPCDAPVDIPCIIAGTEDRTGIVDLHFRLQVPYGDPVMRTDPVIRSILHQRGVAEAIAPQRQDASVLRREGAAETALRVKPEVSTGVAAHPNGLQNDSLCSHTNAFRSFNAQGCSIYLYLKPLDAANVRPNIPTTSTVSCSTRSVRKGCSCSSASRYPASQRMHKQLTLPFAHYDL